VKQFFFSLILIILLLGCAGCINKENTLPTPDISQKENIPTASSISTQKAYPPTVSSVDFNIDSYKGTEDYKFVQVVYKNLTATVIKDRTAFAQTFLPDVDPKTYEYVMNQVERYYKINDIIKNDDQILVTVMYETPTTNSVEKVRSAGRAYILRKSTNSEWLLYTMD
jgi:hypothetical protein